MFEDTFVVTNGGREVYSVQDRPSNKCPSYGTEVAALETRPGS